MWVSSDQLDETAAGWVWWSDRALRRDSGSGVTPTGPVSRRAATPPSHRADVYKDEPPSARAPGKRAHLAHTAHKVRSRRALRMRCPDAAVFRHSPPLIVRPLTTLGHSQWPEPPRFSDATATSPAAVYPTTRPLRASPRRPQQLSLRRRCMPSCGAETHLFSSYLAIDASDTSASRTSWWGPCRPASPNTPPPEASYRAASKLMAVKR